MNRCTWCGYPLEGMRCRSCELYNAAVNAQQAAARTIAETRHPGAKDAFLNSHGIMAWVGGVCRQVGTAEEAAPFARLTSEARKALREDADSGQVLVHTDGCGEVLNEAGFCPKCRFCPDMQSTAFRERA